jgi:hypothetical protein
MSKMYRQVNETRIEYFDTAWTAIVTKLDRQPDRLVQLQSKNSYYSKRLARAHVNCPLEVLRTFASSDLPFLSSVLI